ncbi:MAG: pyruvate dehydrogenase (acetyl-transferring) E1 component subunit alpha [Hyphomicrobiales bacterium]
MDRPVAHFDIYRRSFLDAEGVPVGELPPSASDRAFMRKLYRGMLLARAYDAKCVALQRTGQLGTFATALGQEAVPVGTAAAMAETDVLVPSYREGSAQFWRGVAVEEMLVYWGGDERGHNWADPRVAQDFPVSITVGNHALHAAGVATALKLKRETRAAVCIFGDGATSKGDVYEAMNVAGVWALPLVFVVTNNQWAISTPLKHQTAAETLAQKGLAGGIRVIQADGNDALAVHSCVSEALARARAGEGATLVECITYRLNDHNTADDSTRYREREEVTQRWPADPLKRMKLFLERQGFWSEEDEAQAKVEIAAALDRAVELYLAHPKPGAAQMFAHTYAELPPSLVAQREEALRHG